MIQLEHLSKYYGNLKVLDDLSFKVKEGRICGLLGVNGCGKSTTMDIIAGLLGPSGGNVYVMNKCVLRESIEVKKFIGYLSDNPPTYPEMRVKDFLGFLAVVRKVPFWKKKVSEVIQLCALEDVENRVIAHLSKGFWQRVSLGATLIHDPQVILLDEPTEGLDPIQIYHMREVIRSLAKKKTILMSSHILSEVEELCDDVLILNKGKIVYSSEGKEYKLLKGFFSFNEIHENLVQWFENNHKTKVDKIENEKIIFSYQGECFEKDMALWNEYLMQIGFVPFAMGYYLRNLENIFLQSISYKE